MRDQLRKEAEALTGMLLSLVRLTHPHTTQGGVAWSPTPTTRPLRSTSRMPYATSTTRSSPTSYAT